MITGEYPPASGGIADYTEHLVRAVTDLGHSVDLVLSGSAPEPDVVSRVSTRRIPGWKMSDAARGAQIISDSRPDIVLLQYAPQLYGAAGSAPGLVALVRRLAGERPRGQIIAIAHELYSPWGRSPREAVRSLIHRLQLKNLLGNVDTVVTTNPRYSSTIRTLAPSIPVHVIPVGATIDSPASGRRDREAQAARNGRILLGDFSFASVSKRPLLLLEALRAVGDAADLLCIGGLPVDAAEARAFQRRVAEERMADRVRIEPFCSAKAVSSLMAQVDIYLHTAATGASSRSTSLASALAHGLPVVAFGGTETPAFYQGAMILVSPGDDRGFCEAVVQLCKDRSARSTLGEAGRTAFAANQGWPMIARRLLGVT